MKILHVVWQSRIGGAELFARRLAICQAIQHDVSLIYLGGDKSLLEKVDRVEVSGAGLKSGFDLPGLLRYGAYLGRNRFDVIHIHQNVPAAVISILRGRGAVIVKHEHGTASQDWKTFRERLLSRLISPFVDVYIANSTHTLVQLIKWEGIPEDKIIIIPCGIDVDRFKEGDPKCLRRELGISASTKIVGFAGRLHPQKGVEDFIAAAEIISNVEPDTCFLIAGDGVLRIEIEKKLAASKIGHQTAMLGFRKEMPDVMAAMNVLLIPSRWEPQGLVAVEAMAAGTPVVAFAVGGLPEVLGDAGIMVKDRDVEMLARGAVGLLRDKEHAGQMTSVAIPDHIFQVLSYSPLKAQIMMGCQILMT